MEDYDDLMAAVAKLLPSKDGKLRFPIRTDASTYVRTVDPDFDNPNKPIRKFFFMEVYVPVGFKGDWWNMQHDFTDAPNIDAPVENLIVHGHSSTTVCFTPHFCHHALFDPNTSKNEQFKKSFKNFWKPHYAYPSIED